METRAHFVIIGFFTLLGILGGLGFFLWLGSVQIDRQYAQYGVLFDNVSGLDQSADVLFNGVEVGRVVDIRVWEDDPRLAYVAIEIDAATPVAVDTVARLESQGVTGVAYIALSGGLREAPLLPEEPGGPPIIASRQSSFQSLVTSAPDLIDDTARIIDNMEELTGTANRARIRNILENVDNATAGLERALTDFSDVSASLRTAAEQVEVIVQNVEEVGGAARSTLSAADRSIAAITETFETANETIETLRPAIGEASAAIADIRDLVQEVAPLAGDLRGTLENADATLASADAALGSADRAFNRADELMAAELGPALEGARQAMDDLAETVAAVTADVPVALTEFRAVLADARGAIAALAPGMRDFGRLGGEARVAVRSLDDLIRQLRRNPSGLLSGTRVPEYQR